MDVSEAIDKRRSVRKFVDKEVPDDDIIELVDAARKAPSSGNIQPWKFVLVKDQGVKDQIADACFQQNWISEAPVLIVVVSLNEEVQRLYGERGEVVYTLQNCAMASQNILLRATELGLGSSFVSAFEEGMIKRVVSIPEHARPTGVIAVGYSDEILPEKRLLSIESMTYFDQYENRVADFDEAFYNWSGIIRKNSQRLLRKMKKGSNNLRETIKEKLNKKS